MLDYIWFDDKSPILKQLPKGFNQAAILTNPFIKMPEGWTKNKTEDPNEHIYPDHEEILSLGKPVYWNEVIKNTSLTTLEEVAIALKTSIGAFKKRYARSDLADKLKIYFTGDLFYPDEDSISDFLTVDIIKLFISKGKKTIYYSDPIFDNTGNLELNEITPVDLLNVTIKR